MIGIIVLKIMQSLKKHILIFLSVILFSLLHFSSFGKSTHNVSGYTFQKINNYSFACNSLPFSKISKAQPVNTYVRNRRSVKEEDNFLPDVIPKDKIFYKKSVKFLFPFVEQRHYCFSPGLTLSRAPPVLR